MSQTDVFEHTNHIVTHSNMIVDTNENNCEEKCETILLPNNSHDEMHNTNAILEAIKSELFRNSHSAEVNNNLSIRVENSLLECA